ncbi:MAG: hypothetical protein U0Q18_18245 [Bryobacteraceae bacterium]
MKLCSEKERLAEGLFTALNSLDDVVTELHIRAGAVLSHESDTLFGAVEKAWADVDRARHNLKSHILSHRC